MNDIIVLNCKDSFLLVFHRILAKGGQQEAQAGLCRRPLVGLRGAEMLTGQARRIRVPVLRSIIQLEYVLAGQNATTGKFCLSLRRDNTGRSAG
jgi:hypothetical protein